MNNHSYSCSWLQSHKKARNLANKPFIIMTKLFVYGINSRCPKDLIEDEFSRCGEVTDVFITGKGKPYYQDLNNNMT